MILCLCRGVSERTVVDAIGSGAATVDDIAVACAAGSDCGVCRSALLDLLSATRRSCAIGSGSSTVLP